MPTAMLIDVNAHLGPWPFSLLTERAAPQFAAHLRAHGIGRALVSHLGAVFQPDPMPANRELFAATRRVPALVAVPILNPTLATWREQLDACATATPQLRAVKILPNYHNYSVASPQLDAFVAELHARKLRLVIGTRLEDERHRYFALRIKSVPVPALAKFLRRHPQLHPLLLGLGLPELRALAKECENFSTDLAFIEWQNSVATLVKEFPVSRVMFGSQTPFFVTAASVAKLTAAKLPAKTRAALSHANAERFFSL